MDRLVHHLHAVATETVLALSKCCVWRRESLVMDFAREGNPEVAAPVRPAGWILGSACARWLKGLLHGLQARYFGQWKTEFP